MSNDFNLDQVLDNQNQKETTINSAIGQLAEAFGNPLDIDLTAGNKTLTLAEATRYFNYRRTDTTASRSITVRQIRRYFLVENSAVSTSIIRGTTTIVMSASEKAMFYTDGTANGLTRIISNNPVITDIPQNIAFSGDISPSQITATQNDYNPTGLATATVLRLSSDASRSITGLAGGVDGAWKLAYNVGSFDIVLEDEDVGSSASNRFALGGDSTLGAGKGILIWYDSTSSRWRGIGNPTATSIAFLSLTDVPNNYTGDSLRMVRVNSGETGLEFVEIPMLVSVFVPGAMTDAQLVHQFIATENMKLVAGATGSQAKSGVASTGNVHFDIKKNGSDLGDVTFNVTSTGSFTVASDIDLVAGDLFQIVGPSTADATLADVSITFKFKRTS